MMKAQWQKMIAFYGTALFRDVQLSGMFSDSKTFADAVPKGDWVSIVDRYESQKQEEGFSLAEFVTAHFSLPDDGNISFHGEITERDAFIKAMWETLLHAADETENGSLIPLPNPYIVPGGRFREIYYWDSYFTALGLNIDGEAKTVKSMLDNFVFLQSQVGLIPNGNRAYYYSRSQPPILALMAELVDPDNLEPTYTQAMEKEYLFWMRGEAGLADRNAACERVVRMADGSLLNRFYDPEKTPRPESFKEDIHAAHQLPPEQQGEFYQHIRAACESGWDFSSRWMKDPQEIASIQTTHIVPVDLNCLLFLLEERLAARLADSRPQDARHYADKAQKRKMAILTWLWCEEAGYFKDYNFVSQTLSPVASCAMALPLYAGIATESQASDVAKCVLGQLLRPGGVATTSVYSGQQWDAPNGWAPLQWFVFEGLRRYGYHRIARELGERWLNTTESYFTAHHAMLEKYNVDEPNRTAGGGEYHVQLGFGWSNGVTRAISHRLNSMK